LNGEDLYRSNESRDVVTTGGTRAKINCKKAQAVTGKAWEVNMADPGDLRYMATMAGTTLENDTRQALKMQTSRRRNQRWIALERC